MNIETRRQANRLGHAAEWRAVWRLRLAGYSILARRYKTKLGEIDIDRCDARGGGDRAHAAGSGDDERAFLGESSRSRETDALAGPGDYGDFSREMKVHTAQRAGNMPGPRW